jgi:hypothetical protein
MRISSDDIHEFLVKVSLEEYNGARARADQGNEELLLYSINCFGAGDSYIHLRGITLDDISHFENGVYYNYRKEPIYIFQKFEHAHITAKVIMEFLRIERKAALKALSALTQTFDTNPYSLEVVKE